MSPIANRDTVDIGEMLHQLSSLQAQDLITEIANFQSRFPGFPPIVCPITYQGDVTTIFTAVGNPNTDLLTPALDLSSFNSVSGFVIYSGGAGQCDFRATDDTGAAFVGPLVLLGAIAIQQTFAVGTGVAGGQVGTAFALGMPLPHRAIFAFRAGGVGFSATARIEGRK